MGFNFTIEIAAAGGGYFEIFPTAGGGHLFFFFFEPGPSAYYRAYPNEPWAEVVCEDSPLFPEGKIEVKATFQFVVAGTANA